MTSKTHRRFWESFEKLPADTQRLAVEKFRQWQRDPFHPSLHFKEILSDVWSVRISLSCRALARRKGELIVWFWIGMHDEYDKLIQSLH